MSDLTHFDEHGDARMVDVGEKPITTRVAKASGRVEMRAETLQRIRDGQVAKGDVLAVSRLAGIMAAKRTAELIPLCHALPLDAVEVTFGFEGDTTLTITAVAKATARTGVEMEALTAVSVAALTIYDMCKAVDKQMTIGAIRLEEKSGGRSGQFMRQEE